MTFAPTPEHTTPAGNAHGSQSLPAEALWLPAYLSGATWLTPLAVLVGALASQAVLSRPDAALSLVMAMLLGLAGVFVWRAIAGVNWSLPLARWQAWTEGKPLKSLPYTRPDSDAAYLSQRLGQLRHWLRQALLPQYGNVILLGLMSLAVMAVLAVALGSWAMLLAIGLLCLAQLAVVACRGNGNPNAILEGTVVVGLPILLGNVIFAPVAPDVLLIAIAMAMAFAGIRRGQSLMRDLGYGLAVLTVVAMRQPVAAFTLAAIWAPQLILRLPRGGFGWLAMAMLAFAIMRAIVR